MSFQEKRSLMNIVSSILISGIYFWYILSDANINSLNTDELLVFWVKSLLVLIPVTIGAKIILHIMFSISNSILTRENHPPTDERDMLIELKSTRNAQFVFIFGFFGAMISLAMQMSVNTMFALIICGGILSEIIDNLSQLYFYRKGI